MKSRRSKSTAIPYITSALSDPGGDVVGGRAAQTVYSDVRVEHEDSQEAGQELNGLCDPAVDEFTYPLTDELTDVMKKVRDDVFFPELVQSEENIVLSHESVSGKIVFYPEDGIGGILLGGLPNKRGLGVGILIRIRHRIVSTSCTRTGR